MMTVTPSQHDDDVGQHKMMTTNTTSDEMFKQKSKVPQNGFTGPCEAGLCTSQKLWPSFGLLLLSKQHLVKLEKSLTKLRSQYCLDIASKH